MTDLVVSAVHRERNLTIPGALVRYQGKGNFDFATNKVKVRNSHNFDFVD
jgi:hypothetical protein